VRRFVAATAAAVGMTLSLTTAGVAAANPVPGPPFVERAEWVHWGDLSSLRVYPTQAGRDAAGELGTVVQADEAWAEILTLSPDAALPGMREQFTCHWKFAEFAQPGKTSWNLEPWRPEVTDDQMVAAGCNPGGTEEPF
jgi:Protein of unknown function (DUF2599)